MFTFQENTHFSQALPCTKEAFWEQVKKQTTAWRINARRAILAAVEASKTEGAPALQSWLSSSEYQKFDLKRQNLKKKTSREAWANKTDAEKLKAYAQDLKENLPAFIFCCYKFDETQTEKGKKVNVLLSREYSFFSGASLHKGSVLGASQEADYCLAHQCP